MQKKLLYQDNKNR